MHSPLFGESFITIISKLILLIILVLSPRNINSYIRLNTRLKLNRLTARMETIKNISRDISHVINFLFQGEKVKIAFISSGNNKNSLSNLHILIIWKLHTLFGQRTDQCVITYPVCLPNPVICITYGHTYWSKNAMSLMLKIS